MGAGHLSYRITLDTSIPSTSRFTHIMPHYLQTDRGTPQGGVISPPLANLYLHKVVDTWFAAVIQPRLQRRALLIRYADDLVIVCPHEADARWILEALTQRLACYGLRLHPAKTRMMPFMWPRSDPRTPSASGGPQPR